jgi:uncharacterized protein DUF998
MPVTKKRLVTPRRAALAGMTGPALFGGGLATLTALQYDFLLGIGWQPLRDPSGAWPSGLALGPYGWVQDLDFALCGSLLAVFAVGLHLGITGGSRSGPAFLFVAGGAMALLAFETDPMDRTGPRTLHGMVHDAAFVLFVLALVPALFLLWRQMREDTRWRGHARYTLATALIASACLFLPGAAYYLFLAAVLAWFEVTAVKLWRTEAPSTRVRA